MDGRIGVLNYADDSGAALVRADGPLIPLPYPLATDAFGKMHVVFSTTNHSVDLTYVTGHQELRTLISNQMSVIDLGPSVEDVQFTENDYRAIVLYRDSNVYLVDTHQPPAPVAPGTTIPTADLIQFICTGPLQSGFWSPDDDAELAKTLQGAAPQACTANMHQ